MSTPDVEDRLPATLRALAAGVEAPATPGARSAVQRRTGALRRRRRRGRAAVAGGCLAAVVAVVLARPTGVDPQPDVTTDPAGVDAGVPPGEPGRLPALAVDHPLASPVAALDETGVRPTWENPLPDGGADDTDAVTWQVFRRPGDPTGPILYVTSGPLDRLGPVLDGELGRLVPVDGPVAYEQGGIRTHVRPLDGGRGVRVDAVGLGPGDDEALPDFVGGLVAAPGGSGLEPTTGPEGLVELALAPSSDPAPHPERVLWLDVDGHEATLSVDTWLRTDPDGPEAAFLGRVFGRQVLAEDVRPIEVLGRPGVAVDLVAGETAVLWRHTSTDLAELYLTGVDQATVDELVAGLREPTPDEWAALRASVPRQP
jgi:hypothetical protein